MKKKELILMIVLAAVQFCNIMDFMIVMPLGPILMKTFTISPAQFSLIVSAYAITAFLSNITMSFMSDRFDRKKLLLVVFLGFLLGNLACGLADSYPLLLIGRAFTGIFGGLISATVFSVVGDAVPSERRATAMGIVMAGFSGAAVLGVPVGLLLAAWLRWEAPFLMLTGLSAIILLLIYTIIPPMRGHISKKADRLSPFSIFESISHDRNQQKALLMSTSLILGQFSVIPLIASYMVKNIGFSEYHTFVFYMVGGAFTLFTSPIIGRWADKHGKKKIFSYMAMGSIPVFLLLTNLPPVPMTVALMVTSLFFICVSGRGIPANAMVLSTVSPEHRGGFMNINASLIQLSAGLAALMSSLYIHEDAAGHIVNYNIGGLIAVGMSIIALLLARTIRLREEPAVDESEGLSEGF